MTTESTAANPIPTRELERRWQAMREAMQTAGLDALVMQNSNAFHGGYVKYFTDIPAMYGGYQAVLFPAAAPMITFSHGPAGARDLGGDDPVNRGVATAHSAPTFAAAHYTKHYHSGLVADELNQHGFRTVGLVGTTSMAGAFLEHVRAQVPGAEFTDATDMVDGIKAVKSADEIEFVRRATAMQDAAMKVVLETVQPGWRNFEVTALAMYEGQKLGSEQGLFLAGSAPVGTPNPFRPRHMQDRVIEKGDQVALLIENNGPGGFYSELGRSFVFGKASAEMKDANRFLVEAQQFTIDLLRPGADPASAIASYNAYMRDAGRPEERRLHAHGQGYDLVERPLIFPDETMKISGSMNIVAHPGFVNETMFASICDNYLIGEDGTAERLHTTAQEIFEI